MPTLNKTIKKLLNIVARVRHIFEKLTLFNLRLNRSSKSGFFYPCGIFKSNFKDVRRLRNQRRLNPY